MPEQTPGQRMRRKETFAMRIGIVSSMHHTERMLELQTALKALGHDAYLSRFAAAFVGKNDKEKERIKIDQKNTMNAIREFWDQMQGGDAILVLNLERHGIPNYIGGNSLMEMGFAHVLGQKIYLYHPIPDMPSCKSEIEAMKPVVINEDISLVRA